MLHFSTASAALVSPLSTIAVPTILGGLALIALPTAAFAQGADDCTAPQAITGNGPFGFDTISATTDGMTDPVCGDIFDDVWFSWTAPMSGPYILSLCAGTAGVDPKIAVHEVDCNGVSIACNDDSCGLISETRFIAVSGSTYALRLGNFASGGGSFGDFTVALDAPMQNPNNGHFYQVFSEQLSWTDAKAAAESQLWQGTPGHLVTLQDQAELDWIIQNVAPGRPWIGLSQNLSSPTYSEPDGGYEWVTGEPFTFSNWAVGEPSDTSAVGGSEEFVEMFASGAWNDAVDNHTFTSQYLVEWDGSGFGTNYCSANPNSEGTLGSMSATGSLNVADNDLTLTASSLSRLAFGFFIVSRVEGFVANPAGSMGNLCLGGAIGRYVGPGQIQNSGLAAEIDLTIDLTLIPQPLGFESVAPGETWSFQLWHRDNDSSGMPTSNFTDGLRLTFS
jgi:hypothetical protein